MGESGYIGVTEQEHGNCYDGFYQGFIGFEPPPFQGPGLQGVMFAFRILR